MSVAIVTGSAGLIGAEAARFFAGKGFDVVGIDNDMRQRFFGAEAARAGRAQLWKRACPATGTSMPISATRRAMRKVFAALRPRHRGGHSHRRAALARLGGARSGHRFHRQRQRHAEPAGSRPATLPRGAVHLLQHQQGLWRHAEPAAAGRAGDALGSVARASLRRATASTRRCPSTRRRTACSAPPRRRPI